MNETIDLLFAIKQNLERGVIRDRRYSQYSADSINYAIVMRREHWLAYNYRLPELIMVKIRLMLMCLYCNLD